MFAQLMLKTSWGFSHITRLSLETNISKLQIQWPYVVCLGYHWVAFKYFECICFETPWEKFLLEMPDRRRALRNYSHTLTNLPLFWLPSYLLLTVYCYVPSWWSCFPLLPQHGKMLLESSVPVAHEQAKRTVNEGLRSTPIGLFLTFLHKSNLKETCIFLLAKKSKR